MTDWLFSVKIILTLTLKYFHGEWRIRVTVSMDFHGNGSNDSVYLAIHGFYGKLQPRWKMLN